MGGYDIFTSPVTEMGEPINVPLNMHPIIQDIMLLIKKAAIR
jgi:hypothetical protein